MGDSIQSTEAIALHLVASAVNHACEPNCTLQTGLPFPEVRGWAILQAIRPLSEGEELTIAYLPAGATRRTELLEQWLFDCKCEACLRTVRDAEDHQEEEC